MAKNAKITCCLTFPSVPQHDPILCFHMFWLANVPRSMPNRWGLSVSRFTRLHGFPPHLCLQVRVRWFRLLCLYLNFSASICQQFLSVTYTKNKMYASFCLSDVTAHTLTVHLTSAVIMNHRYKGPLDCAKCSVTHFSAVWGNRVPDHFNRLKICPQSEWKMEIVVNTCVNNVSICVTSLNDFTKWNTWFWLKLCITDHTYRMDVSL